MSFLCDTEGFPRELADSVSSQHWQWCGHVAALPIGGRQQKRWGRCRHIKHTRGLIHPVTPQVLLPFTTKIAHARDCWSTKNERHMLLIWTRPTEWPRAAWADLHSWQWWKGMFVVVNHWDLGTVCRAAKTNVFLFENQSTYSLSTILVSD